MGYSFSRLNETLKIFRLAEENDAFQDESRNIEKLFRETKPLTSRPGAFRGLDPFSDDDVHDDASDDGYDPAHKVSKINFQIKSKGSKRKADKAADGERPKKTPKSTGHTQILSKEDRKTDRNAYFTFQITSVEGRALQTHLATLHCNDVKDIVCNFAARDQRTYFDQLDEEAAQIDSGGGRALRSRKTLVLNCPRCSHVRWNCMCHHKLQPSESERPMPTIVPITHRDSNTQSFSSRSTSVLIPSSKGKERAPSMSPQASVLTPPLTTSQESESFGQDDTSTASLMLVSNTAAGLSQDNPIVLGDTPAIEDIGDECDITTRWSHPINFKQEMACRFCKDVRYGCFGEAARHVTVITNPSSDREQFIEVASRDGKPAPAPTNMCANCALERLYIIDCPSHVYERYMPLGDQEVYHAALMNLGGDDMPKPSFEICSLCPLPGRIKCCTVQTHDKLRNKLNDSTTRGCGLHLCATCWRMMLRLGNKLNARKIERYLEREDQNRMFARELRADAEFLFSDSLLQKAFPRKSDRFC